jgi:predicted DNA-binding antitoxin AbrB/MazE fold protein
MNRTIEAVFDGKVLLPSEPIPLEPNTRVRITVEPISAEEGQQASFLDTACSLNLQGPPDWSVNFDKYLYGEEAGDAE